MSSADISDRLIRSGLSSNEAKVYLVLNDFGSLKAGKISKQTQLDRSSVYNALKVLLQKGFVSYVLVGKVKFFQAASPRRIIEYLKEQQDDLLEVLPELQKRHAAPKIDGQVRLFKGIKGVKSVFLDMIRSGKDNVVFGSEGQFSSVMPEFAQQFDRMKVEKNIRTKLILRSGRKEIDGRTSVHRYISDIAQSPAVINVYDDKVAIIIWTKEPEAILIENAAAAKAFDSYFEFFWKHAKK